MEITQPNKYNYTNCDFRKNQIQKAERYLKQWKDKDIGLWPKNTIADVYISN